MARGPLCLPHEHLLARLAARGGQDAAWCWGATPPITSPVGGVEEAQASSEGEGRRQRLQFASNSPRRRWALALKVSARKLMNSWTRDTARRSRWVRPRFAAGIGSRPGARTEPARARTAKRRRSSQSSSSTGGVCAPRTRAAAQRRVALLRLTTALPKVTFRPSSDCRCPSRCPSSDTPRTPQEAGQEAVSGNVPKAGANGNRRRNPSPRRLRWDHPRSHQPTLPPLHDLALRHGRRRPTTEFGNIHCRPEAGLLRHAAKPPIAAQMTRSGSRASEKLPQAPPAPQEPASEGDGSVDNCAALRHLPPTPPSPARSVALGVPRTTPRLP